VSFIASYRCCTTIARKKLGLLTAVESAAGKRLSLLAAMESATGECIGLLTTVESTARECLGLLAAMESTAREGLSLLTANCHHGHVIDCVVFHIDYSFSVDIYSGLIVDGIAACC
jgi:hypothetical protein